MAEVFLTQPLQIVAGSVAGSDSVVTSVFLKYPKDLEQYYHQSNRLFEPAIQDFDKITTFSNLLL